MAFDAKILADSISPLGKRLTTFELTMPRVIAAEFLTHRAISRNGASSRAIPTEKIIQRVIDDPFIPEFRLNKKGMQAGEALDNKDAKLAEIAWLQSRDEAVAQARYMHGMNVHKQYINRLLEPWMWITYIASATEWANFFHLRVHGDAEPSICKVATMALKEYVSHEPHELDWDEWHLPLVYAEDHEAFDVDDLKLISVGRCARVSYLTHDGRRDPHADIELAARLVQSGHWSPVEHVATPSEGGTSGNFWFWDQYRKWFHNENETGMGRALAYMEANS